MYNILVKSIHKRKHCGTESFFFRLMTNLTKTDTVESYHLFESIDQKRLIKRIKKKIKCSLVICK